MNPMLIALLALIVPSALCYWMLSTRITRLEDLLTDDIERLGRSLDGLSRIQSASADSDHQGIVDAAPLPALRPGSLSAALIQELAKRESRGAR